MPAVTPIEVEPLLTFYSAYADSNAKWRVIKRIGSGVWLCRIIDNLDYNGTEKSFLTEEIQQSLAILVTLQEIHDENQNFLQSQNPGTILHYHNGFGQYVRREVVQVDGVKKLKSIAMVGNWEKHDLPKRYENGEVYYPFHANRILNGKLDDALQCSTTYEHLNFVKPMGGGRDKIDPRKLEPISLEVPSPQGDEKVAIELWQLIESLQDVLNPSTEERLKEGDFKDPATPMKRLRAAYELLSPILDGKRED